jgi:hypothetical protein
MDAQPGEKQQDVSPEATLALTRELISRSRATIDQASRQLRARGEHEERPRRPSDDR